MSHSKEFEVIIPGLFLSFISVLGISSVFAPLSINFIYKGESDDFPKSVEYLVVAPSLSSAVAARDYLDSLRILIRASYPPCDFPDVAKSLSSKWSFGLIRDSY